MQVYYIFRKLLNIKENEFNDLVRLWLKHQWLNVIKGV